MYIYFLIRTGEPMKIDVFVWFVKRAQLNSYDRRRRDLKVCKITNGTINERPTKRANSPFVERTGWQSGRTV